MLSTATAWRNIKASYRQGISDVRAWLATGKHKRFLWLLPAAAAVAFATRLFCDSEYDGQDITQHGLDIFSSDILGTYFKPSGQRSATSPQKPSFTPVAAAEAKTISGAFPDGFGTTNQPHDMGHIAQGAVYDCRFLATLSSFAATDPGKKAIMQMIQTGAGETYTVIFPGAPKEHFTVAPLNVLEKKLYAHALDARGKPAGNWVGILEKAYGQYRIEHQTVSDRILHCMRHGLLERRWTSTPLLPGFGASFGARDDDACQLLSGSTMVQYPTISWEIGTFGVGKDYATGRQIRSWFDRAAVVDELFAQQERILDEFSHKQIIATATTEAGNDAVTQGLRTNHAYAVIGYDRLTKQITLSDPYSNGDFMDPFTGKVRDGIDDGVFKLSLAEFNQYFSHIAVAQPQAQHH